MKRVTTSAHFDHIRGEGKQIPPRNQGTYNIIDTRSAAYNNQRSQVTQFGFFCEARFIFLPSPLRVRGVYAII